MALLYYRDPDTGELVALPFITGGMDQGAADARFVKRAGDVISGNYGVDNAASTWLRLKSTDGYAELRVTSADAFSAGVLLQKNDSTRWKLSAAADAAADLNVGRYDSNGDYVDTAFKIYRDTGEVEIGGLVTGTVTPASGWSANSVVWMRRAGWCMVTVDGIKKSTPSASGDVMFTLPVGSRLAYQTLWIPMLGNVAVSGALKNYLGSMSSNGQMLVRGGAVPLANEALYFNISFPCA